MWHGCLSVTQRLVVARNLSKWSRGGGGGRGGGRGGGGGGRGRAASTSDRRRDSHQPTDGSEAVFGFHAVASALQAGRRDQHKLLIDADAFSAKGSGTQRKRRHVQACSAAALEAQIPVAHVKTAVLDAAAKSRPHQGVVLLCDPVPVHPPPTAVTFAGTEARSPRLWLLLERVHDVHNIGAMLRTALFFGVERVLLCECAAPSAAVARASAGAMEWITLHEVTDAVETIELARESGWDVVGTDMVGDPTNADNHSKARGIPVDQYEVSAPTLLCFGNEGAGLRPQTLEACTATVGIPRRFSSEAAGLAQHTRPPLFELDSLNVSVSCGVVLAKLTSARPPPAPPTPPQ